MKINKIPGKTNKREVKILNSHMIGAIANVVNEISHPELSPKFNFIKYEAVPVAYKYKYSCLQKVFPVIRLQMSAGIVVNHIGIAVKKLVATKIGTVSRDTEKIASVVVSVVDRIDDIVAPK